MEKERLSWLISRYLSGNITEEEKHTLELYWSSSVDKHQQIDFMTTEEKEKLKEKLYEDILVNASKKSSSPYQKRLPVFPLIRIAATLTGILLICFAAWWFLSPSVIEYTTDYGETQQIVLPDSSVVTLNASSTLKLASHWSHHEDRLVHLEGEAFFDVRHKDTKFMVQTSDLIVEVLGTKFNVNNRRNKTQVVLNSGKIRLNLAQKEDLLMQPGELTEFSKSSGQLIQKKVDPEVFSSWRNKTLMFDGTPLSEIAQLLEDIYGLEVEIKNPALAGRRLTGEIASTDLDMFLNTLPELLDIKVTRQGKKLILENR